jgi:hypothetical protein
MHVFALWFCLFVACDHPECFYLGGSFLDGGLPSWSVVVGVSVPPYNIFPPKQKYSGWPLATNQQTPSQSGANP